MWFGLELPFRTWYTSGKIEYHCSLVCSYCSWFCLELLFRTLYTAENSNNRTSHCSLVCSYWRDHWKLGSKTQTFTLVIWDVWCSVLLSLSNVSFFCSLFLVSRFHEHTQSHHMRQWKPTPGVYVPIQMTTLEVDPFAPFFDFGAWRWRWLLG